MTLSADRQVSVVMVGIGGYGHFYLKTLLEEFPPGRIDLCGVVDPVVERSDYYPEIRRRGIPNFSSIEDFYASGRSARLAVIASPIHYHVPQSCVALGHGSHVLCDKPIGATVQEADELIGARDASGKWVMIGYQWSYSGAIQLLKRDIMAGAFGKPLRLKTLCLWSRDDAYYHRNDWAGKIQDAEGRWVLDSPVNNAMAHFLHNMFYVLGEDVARSAQPKETTAELYRANPIENYDTAACRIFTDDGAELLFYVSHATLGDRGPVFEFEFEDAVVSFGEYTDDIVAQDKQGREKRYGSPDADHQFRKLFEAVEAVNAPVPIVCGVETARSQTVCINGIQESMPDIVTFPRSVIQRDEELQRWWVKGLDEVLVKCYQKGVLPSESGVPWAKAGWMVDLEDYHYFPGGVKPSVGRR
jgi:predicted dehydrogenase